MAASPLKVRFAYSKKISADSCVQDLKKQFGDIKPTLIIFFCASSYDLSSLGAAFEKAFSCTISGCTTAGELSFMAPGYSKDTVVAVALESKSLKAKTYLIPDLDQFNLTKSTQLHSEIITDFPLVDEGADHFGMLLIDGMSFSEEQTIGAITAAFSHLPIIGGSAGDDFRFQNTYVYHDGKFHSNSCTLTIVETTHKFKLFQTQHFEPTETKLVITEVEPQKRLVSEINGYPAAQEYARLIGINREELDEDCASLHPLMLKIGGEYHIRSIQQINDDSLTFFCAIDTGLVLTVGKGKNIHKVTRKSLQTAASEFNSLAFTLGYDCAQRRLETEALQLHHEMSRLFTEYQVIGFSTYGEQYNGFHVNQTLTAMMLGD